MIPSTLQSGQIVLDLVGREELDLDADRLRDAGVIIVLVHPVAGAREADVRHLAKADVEARSPFQRLVERDRIFMDLPDRIAEVEQRQQPRRMPGRAGGQLLALDENAVGPAFLGEMIERRDADHAPADHHRPRVRSHSIPLELRASDPAFVDNRTPPPTIASQSRGNANHEQAEVAAVVLPHDDGRCARGLSERKRRHSAGRQHHRLIGAILHRHLGPRSQNLAADPRPQESELSARDRTAGRNASPKRRKAISSLARRIRPPRSLPRRRASRTGKSIPSPCRRTTARSSIPA